MQRKEHLTPEGLEKIVALKASLNLGLSGKLKAAFPDTVPGPRPQGQSIKIPDPSLISAPRPSTGLVLGRALRAQRRYASLRRRCFATRERGCEAIFLLFIIF